jgi:hypothetical protein
VRNSLCLTGIILLLAVSNLSAATHFVWQESPSPGSPCDTWVNAARGDSACALNNCTLTGNSAEAGGGASASTLYNCTVADIRGE